MKPDKYFYRVLEVVDSPDKIHVQYISVLENFSESESRLILHNFVGGVYVDTFHVDMTKASAKSYLRVMTDSHNQLKPIPKFAGKLIEDEIAKKVLHINHKVVF